jgi:hypothetical protein
VFGCLPVAEDTTVVRGRLGWRGFLGRRRVVGPVEDPRKIRSGLPKNVAVLLTSVGTPGSSNGFLAVGSAAGWRCLAQAGRAGSLDRFEQTKWTLRELRGMAETATGSDKAVGLGLLFGLLGIAGAVVMYVAAADQVTAGFGFALAMLAGSLAIAAIHLFW